MKGSWQAGRVRLGQRDRQQGTVRGTAASPTATASTSSAVSTAASTASACSARPSSSRPAAPFGVVPECAGTTAAALGFRPPSGAKAVTVSRGSVATRQPGAAEGRRDQRHDQVVGRTSRLVETSVYCDEGDQDPRFARSPSTARTRSIRLPAGTGYVVCFSASQAVGGSSKSGYLSQCWKNKAWSGSGKAPAGAKTVKVSAGKNTKGVNAVLHPGGAIAGKIVSGSHKPIRTRSSSSTRARTPLASPAPRTDGTYTVGGLTAGSYKVCASGGSVQRLVERVRRPLLQERGMVGHREAADARQERLGEDREARTAMSTSRCRRTRRGRSRASSRVRAGVGSQWCRGVRLPRQSNEVQAATDGIGWDLHGQRPASRQPATAVCFSTATATPAVRIASGHRLQQRVLQDGEVGHRGGAGRREGSRRQSGQDHRHVNATR